MLKWLKNRVGKRFGYSAVSSSEPTGASTVSAPVAAPKTHKKSSKILEITSEIKAKLTPHTPASSEQKHAAVDALQPHDIAAYAIRLRTAISLNTGDIPPTTQQEITQSAAMLLTSIYQMPQIDDQSIRTVCQAYKAIMDNKTVFQPIQFHEKPSPLVIPHQIPAIVKLYHEALEKLKPFIDIVEAKETKLSVDQWVNLAESFIDVYDTYFRPVLQFDYRQVMEFEEARVLDAPLARLRNATSLLASKDSRTDRIVGHLTREALLTAPAPTSAVPRTTVLPESQAPELSPDQMKQLKSTVETHARERAMMPVKDYLAPASPRFFQGDQDLAARAAAKASRTEQHPVPNPTPSATATTPLLTTPGLAYGSSSE